MANTKRIDIHFSEENMEFLEWYAAQMGCSVKEAMRLIFIYGFKNIKMQCEDDFFTSKFLLL